MTVYRPFDEGSTGDSLDDFFSSFEVALTQSTSAWTSPSSKNKKSTPPPEKEEHPTTSSSPASVGHLFPHDEEDAGFGVEATATLTYQDDGGYKIYPDQTILTTSSNLYTTTTTPVSPKVRSLSDNGDDDKIPTAVASSPSSHYDEYGFPLFTSSFHSTQPTTVADESTSLLSLLADKSQRSAAKSNQTAATSLSLWSTHRQNLPSTTTSTSRSLLTPSTGGGAATHRRSPRRVDEVIKVLSLDIKDSRTKTKVKQAYHTEDLIYTHPHPEIDCNLSSTSVSTMTKENQSIQSYQKVRKRPIHNSHQGITKAFSKLALCGHSAREDSLNLEYVVLTLKQAITTEEATASLKHVVKVLKDGRNQTGNHKNGMSTTELQEGLVAAGADHCVISTLWNFPSNIPVQYYGIVALGELVAHSHLPNQKSIVLKGGIEVVLTAMKTHIEQEAVQEEACRTLKNIMKYFDTAKQQVTRHKGISRILQAMMTHPEYATVQRQACYALTSLSCLKTISDELVLKQGHAVLLKTMQHHNDDPYVLAESWRTLTNIIIHAMNTTLDEEIAAHGVPLVFEALHKFADCTLVPIQARGMTLLTHLCYRSPANLEQVTQTDHLEIIHRILQLWRYDEKVQAAGEKLVQQITQAGYPGPAMMMMPNRGVSPPVTGRSNSAKRAGRSISRTSRRNARSQSSSSSRNNNKPPPPNAVISQIRNERGLDVIVDATMY
ncbi:armadillo repeat containing 6 [Seminavis robusta]|uniref:Armadillo repeat containing 6 n=1 Tax=Seminavis robusta TaxID=568900 RepID=A0A9N8EFV0_9STRA|nr:armadillo repeat containing 6 [Seminavis robusta]|eukprot:Sro874_g214240.1 armadillo repeat containing 6 (719) ;mRNA; f:26711-28867